LVVVDEFSMVDAALAHNLLKAIPPSCRIVLVGDVDQLPSVGPGSVLADLIRSERVDVVRLETIFRQAEASKIIVNAHRVNRGQMPLIEDASSGTDFFFIERAEPEAVLGAVESLVHERIPRRFGLDPIMVIQVLTPMHRGLLGATNLNAELQRLLNPSGESITRGNRILRVGDKVLQTRNNYDLDVYNGDIGRITQIDPVDRRAWIRYDDRAVAYDHSDLDEVSLAYACSIHKAQGSEYPCVVILLHTQHHMMLQRNLLYTAITRGRRLAVLVGNRRALALAVKNNRTSERYTRLAERLRELAGPALT
jgi:exodeoxyribonuclease V alpha subunit